MSKITHCGITTKIESGDGIVSLTLSNVSTRDPVFKEELIAMHAKLEKFLKEEIVFSKPGCFNSGYHVKIEGDMWSGKPAPKEDKV